MNPTPLTADSDDDYQRAAEWIDFLSEQPLDDLSRRRFVLWLDGSPERRALFERMLANWADPALTQAAQALLADIPLSRSSRFRWQPTRTGAALAACMSLCIALLISKPWWNESPAAHKTLPFATAIGLRHDLQLADGSLLEISPASRVEINLNDQRRNISLQQGAAYFRVAKDQTRPFEVRIGAASVIAVGTEFNIDKTADQIEVTVYEGAIEVREHPKARPHLLRAGERALIGASGLRTLTVKLNEVVDWRSGWLEVDDSKLGALVEQLNRYSSKPIRLQDQNLADTPVAGRFRLKDTRETLQLLAELYPLQFKEVTAQGEAEIHLTRKP